MLRLKLRARLQTPLRPVEWVHALRVGSLAIVFWGTIAAGPIAAADRPKPTAPAGGPLRVHPDNPRYFTDGTGKAIYLTGSHMGWELQDHSWGREHVFDFPGFVEALAARHHNFMRLWMVEHTRSEKENPRAVATPMPYRRTGPGTALDGQPRFDLEQLDPAYFERLRARVQAAGERGIYVAVMLFQGFSLHQTRGRNPWFGHPFNPANNINGIDADTNRDGDGREVHTLADARVTALQERYIRKVVDTVNDLDNVLYEIGNECGVYSTEWQYQTIRFVKRYETGKPKQHPVGMTVQIPGGHRNNQVLFDSPADWISPNNEGGYGQDPPAAEGRKVILSDTDHHGHKPYPGRREWVWKSFLRGHNPIFLDLYPDQETKQLDRITRSEPDPQWEPIRQAMGRTRLVAERIDLAAMPPRNELAATGYCLANPGAEYLVYLPDGKGTTVDLGGERQSFAAEWFNPETGETRLAKPVQGAGTVSFVSPFQSKDAVLYLRREHQPGLGAGRDDHLPSP